MKLRGAVLCVIAAALAGCATSFKEAMGDNPDVREVCVQPHKQVGDVVREPSDGSLWAITQEGSPNDAARAAYTIAGIAVALAGGTPGYAYAHCKDQRKRVMVEKLGPNDLIDLELGRAMRAMQRSNSGTRSQ